MRFCQWPAHIGKARFLFFCFLVTHDFSGGRRLLVSEALDGNGSFRLQRSPRPAAVQAPDPFSAMVML